LVVTNPPAYRTIVFFTMAKSFFGTSPWITKRPKDKGDRYPSSYGGLVKGSPNKPKVNIIKTFFFVTDATDKKARMYVSGKVFSA